MRKGIRMLYWLIAGGMMGFGIMAFGLGLLPALFGAVMALYGIRRFGSEGFWMTLIGIGTVPAVVLLLGYLMAQSSNIFAGPPPFGAIAVFGGVVLAGIIWGVIEAYRGRGIPPQQVQKQ